ncbi:hypothetical protein F4777DRAFT_301747 [Nemania sp. FL0916]|nr:hypothetical protein F4777DRAFT_301747 [Nemania sp. FL0916]
MAPTRPPCSTCNEAEGKYRCTRCDAITCSVACSREHRDNHPVIEDKPKPVQYAIPTVVEQALAISDEKHPVKLSDIADSLEYKNLLQRYPDLEIYLWHIAAATDPPQPGQGGNQARKQNQQWTSEEGMSSGVKLVQTIKASPGDVRDAIREFSDLVSIFKDRIRMQDENVRKLRAEEDARIINGLLKQEKS